MQNLSFVKGGTHDHTVMHQSNVQVPVFFNVQVPVFFLKDGQQKNMIYINKKYNLHLSPIIIKSDKLKKHWLTISILSSLLERIENAKVMTVQEASAK